NFLLTRDAEHGHAALWVDRQIRLARRFSLRGDQRGALELGADFPKDDVGCERACSRRGEELISHAFPPMPRLRAEADVAGLTRLLLIDCHQGGAGSKRRFLWLSH